MPSTPSGRRSLNTRGSTVRKLGDSAPTSRAFSNSEPPLKKRRYVPGGPGGGGRYVDTDGKETLVSGGGPTGFAYMAPRRSRFGRESGAGRVPPTAFSPRPRRESQRERAPARSRLSSAAAAAAAVAHGDGFKPREERGWEEFHQDLDIETSFPVFTSFEVDGIQKPTPQPTTGVSDEALKDSFESREDGLQQEANGTQGTPTRKNGSHTASPEVQEWESRRRSGRPPRRTNSMLKGIGTPDMPKRVPLPGFNPREKLMLPKPNFRRVDPFDKFEEKGINLVNYVDKSMANIGYQESEIYVRPENNLIRVTEGNIEDDLDTSNSAKAESDIGSVPGGSSFGRVEYDMDEQDTHWLETLNEQRNNEQFQAIKPSTFEATMTKIEKEWYALERRIPKPNPKPPQTQRPRSSSAAAVNGELAAPGEEQDTKCAICDDGDCENTNAIVFCDGCDLAVHQECYGVPFIPEGQWLCRKCQLIGRGTPTCIFCPNTDGAFKQTNASRWSHLLCAIWIPEVSIGNTTFMEPVMDVEKVPKPRWKLTCYICRQKMGACIQCGNKNCYIAFHVTCARRARLYLKMKSTHGGPASVDASVLKAYCDKHVPADWRREQDVDTAIVDTMDHYRRTMRGRLWADSQQAALTIMPAPTQDPFAPDVADENSNPKITLKFSAGGRNRNQAPKIVWRLPSGAPVIPQTVYNSVENALGRAAISKRKEFAAEMCKYWTLKREARRGAALLKRLQLQMETFTSLEITRRNFVGMGAAGGVRLQRRIDFADTLLKDVGDLKNLCSQIKDREYQKLEDALVLKNLVDTVYFPIGPLLQPILKKARTLDGKRVFEQTFSTVQERLDDRLYIAVIDFAVDLTIPLAEAMRPPNNVEMPDLSLSNGTTHSNTLSNDFKQKKALAKRILKAIQIPLEGVLLNENELRKRPADEDLGRLGRMLKGEDREAHNTVERLSESRYHTANGDANHGTDASATEVRESPPASSDIDPAIASISGKTSRTGSGKSHKKAARRLTPEPTPQINGANTTNNHDQEMVTDLISTHPEVNGAKAEPPTPPSSTSDEIALPFSGGVPWYMDAFDPEGTTVYEEKAEIDHGPHSVSDDLSDMDEDALSDLVEDKAIKTGAGSNKRRPRAPSTTTAKASKSTVKRRKRHR